MHVTLRLAEGLPSLRRGREYRAVVRAFEGGREGEGFRLVHYSVQTNHLHLIVEGEGRAALSRGLKGLSIRVAKALNRAWRRRGRVFGDRFHEHVLKTPREVRNALRYVLENARRHGARLRDRFDPFSSARWFDGWRGLSAQRCAGLRLPVSAARSWLLRVGWRRHGLLTAASSP